MIWITLLLFSLVVSKADQTIVHGVISATSSNKSVPEKFCTTFNPKWFHSTIFFNETSAPSYPTNTLSNPLTGCEESLPDLDGTAAVIVDSGLCSVYNRSVKLVEAGAELIIIARLKHGTLNVSGVAETNFSSVPIMLINSNSYGTLEHLDGNYDDLSISFYYPTTKFDGNILFISFACIFCIVVGSYWSLYPQNMKISEIWTTTPKPRIRLSLRTTDEPEDTEEKSSTLSNILFAGVIVGIMAGMLLLLYYAYAYFVYVFMALFCVIASTGMYSILYPFAAELRVFHTQFSVRFWGKDRSICPLMISLWLLCLCVSISWFLNRHVYEIWPLQLVMGVAVCLNIIKTVHLPNMKIIAIIMVCLFFYDIFFVFLTPLFTKDNVSIMEKVATGASSRKPVFDAPEDYTPHEQIPLALKVPYFQQTDVKVCGPLYGMIGFGDIIIPGFLTGYAAYFDTLAHPGEIKWYYIISCLAYAVGLVLTYIALIGMKMAQPALLYLVPCLLIATFGAAFKRGELTAMLSGRAGVAAPQPFEDEPDTEVESRH